MIGMLGRILCRALPLTRADHELDRELRLLEPALLTRRYEGTGSFLGRVRIATACASRPSIDVWCRHALLPTPAGVHLPTRGRKSSQRTGESKAGNPAARVQAEPNQVAAAPRPVKATPPPLRSGPSGDRPRSCGSRRRYEGKTSLSLSGTKERTARSADRATPAGSRRGNVWDHHHEVRALTAVFRASPRAPTEKNKKTSGREVLCLD
jgi:hypothetical protein